MQRYAKFTVIASMLVGLNIVDAAAQNRSHSGGRFHLDIEGTKSGYLKPVESENSTGTQQAKPGVAAPRSKPAAALKKMSPARDPVPKKPRPARSK